MLSNPDHILWIAAVAFIVSATIRAGLRSRSYKKSPNALANGRLSLLATALRAAGALLLALALYNGLALFLPETKPITAVVLGAGLALSVIIDTLSIFRWPQSAGATARWRSVTGASAIALFGLSTFSYTMYARSAPPHAIHLDWPVRGSWHTAAGGRLKLTNQHHNNPPAQNYAVDLVTATAGNQTSGQPVYSPIGGTCIRAETNPSSAEGCNIVLRIAGNIEITFAHLKEGSITVKQDDEIVAGQKFAECGDTGSATIPHLHIHAEQNGRAIPMRFGPKKLFMVRGDRLQSP